MNLLPTTTHNEINIFDFASSPTANYVIKHPHTFKPTNLWVSLLGSDSVDRQRLDFETARASVAREQEKKANGDTEIDDLDQDAIYAKNTTYLVTCVTAWNFKDRDGNDLPCDDATKRAVFTDPARTWLRNQLLVALNSNELFILASPQTLASAPAQSMN